MRITIPSFLMAFLLGSIMIMFLYMLCTHNFWFFRTNCNSLLLFALIITLRILLPFEAPYAITVPIHKFYPVAIAFFRTPLFKLNIENIMIYHLLLFVWIAGSLCYSIRLIFNYKKFISFSKFVVSTSKEKGDTISFYDNINVKIVKSNYVSTPCTTGILRNVIFLPNIDISASDMEFIISHEIQHIKNHDIILKLLLELLCTLYWWNPAMFLLKEQALNLLELRVDTDISKDWNHQQRLNYLECIKNVYKIQTTCLDRKYILRLKGENKSFLVRRAQKLIKGKTITNCLFPALLSILLVLSTFLIFEPSRIPEKVTAKTYSLTDLSTNSYILHNDDGSYSLYNNNEYLCDISNPYTEDFKNIPIYFNNEEKNHEKIN